jgi:succinate dehydrogenase / fumarate reductase membrane anchor subunit
MVNRTPLAEVRGLGSAKKGTGEWIASRLTSVALAILLIPFLVVVIALNGEPYETVVGVLAAPAVAILLLGTILITAVHMRLGMQVIIEDYVQDEMPKFVLLIANWLFSWAVALVAAFAILKIAFGG